MVRPIAQRLDRQHVQQRMGDTLKKRHASLKAFRAMLDEDEIKRDLATDDRLFGSIVHLAIEEYGVRQATLADDLQTSDATVGRWTKAWMDKEDPEYRKPSLPPGYARVPIIAAIKVRLDETIAKHEELYATSN